MKDRRSGRRYGREPARFCNTHAGGPVQLMSLSLGASPFPPESLLKGQG